MSCLKEGSPRPFGDRVGAASWTAQVLLHTSTAAPATRDPKDSEVRNRGAQGAGHTPSGCSAISDRGARQQLDDSRNRIPLFLPAVKLRVD